MERFFDNLSIYNKEKDKRDPKQVKEWREHLEEHFKILLEKELSNIKKEYKKLYLDNVLNDEKSFIDFFEKTIKNT